MSRKPQHKPSLASLRFLAWFCPPKLYEGVAGDLLEQFEREVEEQGVEKARRRLMWNVIKFFRPGIILRNGFSIQLIQLGMIGNYLKVAWRSMLRNRAYAFINITGLTLGLGIAIVLFWIVRFEYGFDTYHTNTDRLYQIKMLDKFGEPQSHVPQGVIKALTEQVPEVEKAANILRWDPQVIRVGNKNLKQVNTYFLHPEFLEMIDVKWKSGSPQKSLNELYQVVLDEPTAQKLFLDEDPLGKIIRYDNTMDLVVSGVIEKMPVQSDFQFEMIMSYETLTKYQGQYAYEDHWGGGDSWFHGYALVKDRADIRPLKIN